MAWTMAGSRLPGGTVTFLFTDMEGSTRLLRELGREGYGVLLARHNELLRLVFAGRDGVEVDRAGDGFFVAFRSAEAAVGAAAGAQLAIAGEPWPGELDVRIRVGLHTGEATVGSDGYVGFAVHMAARICAAGEPGQVTLSAATARVVEHELPGSLRLRDLGERQLAGAGHSVRLYRLEPAGATAEPIRAPRVSGGAGAATSLLEREVEMAALAAHLEAARDGAGCLLVVEARAGMGKTRLLGEVRGIAVAAGFEVLAARAGEMEREFGFGVVRQLFEPLLSTATGEDRSDLLSGAAALSKPLFDDVDIHPDQVRGDVSFPILHGLYWLAANLALRTPAVMLVDDLHWADAPSMRWISYLVRRLDGLPLLVVAATRPPDESHDQTALEEVLADPTTRVVRPTPLGGEAVATLIRETLQAEPEDAFVSAIETASGGNPLFVRALLDACQREQLSPSAQNVEGVTNIGAEAVSRGVSIRLARMSADARALVRAAAVLSDRTQLATTARLAELDAARAGDAATELVRSNLLRQEDPIEFTHPIVRTAIHDRMTAGERADAHYRAAQLLIEANALPERAAAHLVLTIPASDPFVVDTLERAADRSLARGAPETAAVYLRRALAEASPGDHRAGLLHTLGMAELTVDPPAALEHLREAIEATGDDHAYARATLAYALALQYQSQWREAMAAVDRARARVGDARTDLSNRLEAMAASAGQFTPEGTIAAVGRLATIDPDELVAGVGASQLRGTIAIYRAYRCESRDSVVELARAAVADADAFRDRISVILVNAMLALAYAGEFDAAARAWDEFLAEARRRGDLLQTGVALAFRGNTSTMRGDLFGAEADLRSPEVESLASLPVAGHTAAAFLADVLIELGELDTASQKLDYADSGDPVDTARYAAPARARCLLAAGSPSDALRICEGWERTCEALGIHNPAIVPWRSLSALALHALGRRDEAVTAAADELTLARKWGAPHVIGTSLRALGLVTGGAAGERSLRDAVDVLGNSPARLEHARALVDLGASLRRHNQRSDARELLRQGQDLAHRCGAVALVARAGEELAATGARPRRLLLTGLESLTPSERRVARMAADGMTNKAIAQALFVTPRTHQLARRALRWEFPRPRTSRR